MQQTIRVVCKIRTIYSEPEANPQPWLKIVNCAETHRLIKNDRIAQIDADCGAPRRIIFEDSAKVHCEKGFPIQPRIEMGAAKMPDSGACLSKNSKPI